MITAHLPSGYVLARFLPKDRLVAYAAMLGAVFPDFDLLWFYLVDHGAMHHHRYLVHVPMFWGFVVVVTLPLIGRFMPRLYRPALAFFSAVILHILLDSIAGDIMWAWPFSDRLYHLVTVPARFDYWLLNFILHPVFLLECLIWIWAILLVRKKAR